MGAQCQWHDYVDYCQRPAVSGHGRSFCIFHLRNPQKPDFQEKFLERLENGERDFRGFVFPKDFVLHNKRLEEADFSDSEFFGTPNLSGSIFKESLFTGARFEKGAIFGETNLGQAPLFRVEERGQLTTAIQGQMRSSIFQDCDFQRCKFLEPVNFYWCQFSGNNNFSGAKFKSRPNFHACRFEGYASFSHCEFGQSANFSTTSFATVFFSEATFLGNAEFDWCRIEDAYFHKTVFGGRISFAHSEVVHLLHLAKPSLRGGMDFREVGILADARVNFGECDLRKALFCGTDMLRCGFRDVEWPNKGGRVRLFDEDSEETKHKTSALRELYRRLRLNYENDHRFEEAAGFHISEMQMRLRIEGSFSKMTTWLYKMSSLYGESYKRAFAVFICLWFLPVAVYSVTGLTDVSTGKKVLFDPAPSLSFLLDGDYWKIVTISLRSMFMQLPRDLVVSSPAGQVMQLMQLILGPLQTAMFVLALRRAYKK